MWCVLRRCGQRARRTQRRGPHLLAGVVDERVAEAHLGQLPLEDLLLDRARRQKAVDPHALALALAPHARHRLRVARRVPVRVEQHEPVRADDVEPDAARFGREQEAERLVARVVEAVDERLALLDAAGAVEAQRVPLVGGAHAAEHVEGLFFVVVLFECWDVLFVALLLVL